MEKKKELENLLVSVSENDDYAFRVFYDLYYRSVFRFAYYFLRNREACGEVVSNVFVAVWKSRVALRRIENIDAYLYVVARNEAIEAEVEELVRRLINDLPERCRTVFLLNRQEGLSSREIAEALSLSESTVRVQIKIAVDRIVAGIRTHYPDLKLVSLLLFLFTARF